MTPEESGMVECSGLTYCEMAQIVNDIRLEVKRRNSIGVNLYVGALERAALDLWEISGGEQGNFTSECGPKEPRRKRGPVTLWYRPLWGKGKKR